MKNKSLVLTDSPVKHLLCLLLILMLYGCTKQHYKPVPVSLEQNYRQISDNSPLDPSFKLFLESRDYPIEQWPIKRWDLALLTYAAIYFNPSIKLARVAVEIQDTRIAIADQRSNPGIGLPLEFHSQAGDSPWLIGVIGDFLFERESKREARVEQANANRRIAEIKLEKQIWSIYSRLHKHLLDYYAAVKQRTYLGRQKELLEQILALLKNRQASGQISQFEVSTVRLQLQQIRLRLSDQVYLVNNAFHDLIANTDLQVSQFEKEAIDFRQMETALFGMRLNQEYLQEHALHTRFDLHIKLAQYQVLESALKLALEKQYPDLNLSPGFIFDQGDKIWTLGVAWVLPLFHNNEGQIREALAKRRQMQIEILGTQTSLLNQLAQGYQNYSDKKNVYQETLRLLNALDERVSEIKKQFDSGYSDSLAVLHSQLEYERANQALFSSKMAVWRQLLKLEEVMEQPLYQDIDLKEEPNTPSNKALPLEMRTRQEHNQ